MEELYVRGVVKLSGSLHVTLKGPYEDEVRIRCSTFKVDLQLILENTFFSKFTKNEKDVQSNKNAFQ